MGYRAVFGVQATPTLVVYDRGLCRGHHQGARHRRGQGDWYQPKGHGAWHVAEAVRETVRSERGKTEGIIGTLKTDKYGFNKPKERLWQTLEMVEPPVYPLLQSEQVDTGPGTRQQVRRHHGARQHRQHSDRRAERGRSGDPWGRSQEFCDTLYIKRAIRS